MRKAAVVAVLVVTLFAGIAQATLGTVDLKYAGQTTSGTYKFKLFGPGTAAQYPKLGQQVHVQGGMMKYQLQNATGEAVFLNNPEYGFCFELTQNTKNDFRAYKMVQVRDGQDPHDFLGGPLGLEKENLLKELWGRFFDGQWVLGNADDAAKAFDIAIKEIVYDYQSGLPQSGWFDLGSGNFTLTTSDPGAAAMLGALDGTGPKEENLRALVHPTFQDYLVVVPEPATVAMLSVGALSLVIRKRK